MLLIILLQLLLLRLLLLLGVSRRAEDLKKPYTALAQLLNCSPKEVCIGCLTAFTHRDDGPPVKAV